MEEILRTNDVVLLSYAQSLLSDAGIETVVLDAHMSVVDGSIGALPRRLMVSSEQIEAAVLRLKEADITVREELGGTDS